LTEINLRNLALTSQAEPKEAAYQAHTARKSGTSDSYFAPSDRAGPERIHGPDFLCRRFDLGADASQGSDETSQLGFVHGVAVTLFASSFLHIFKLLLLLFQLSLHVLHFVLFFDLEFVPLFAVAYTVARGKTN
jgi:hypothetical protein